MLAHLTKASGGLKRVDTVNLLVSLTQLWEQEPHIPEYLNGLRDVQKKAKRADQPFFGRPSCRHCTLLAPQGELLPQGPPQMGWQNPRGLDPAGMGVLIPTPPQRSITGIKTGDGPQKHLWFRTLLRPCPRYHKLHHGGNNREPHRGRPCLLHGAVWRPLWSPVRRSHRKHCCDGGTGHGHHHAVQNNYGPHG